MADNDFDDFFEVDAEGKTSETTSIQPDPTLAPKAPAAEKPAPKPAAAAPKPAAPAPPSAPPAKTDDKLLSDFGDFDALFDKADEAAKAAPAPTAGKSSSVEDLLSEFQTEEAPTVKAPAPKVPPKTPPKFGGDAEKTQAMPQAKAAPPPPKPAPPKPAAPKTVAAKPAVSDEGESGEFTDKVVPTDDGLEDLFSEVSEAGVSSQEGQADALESGLGLEYKQRKRNYKKIALIAGPTLGVVFALVVLVMARFTESGFMGWKFGQAPKDGYVPPSSSVLKKLDAQYKATTPLFATDRIEDYRKVESEFEAILKTDSRHSPTDARLAEALLLMGDRTIASNARKKINSLIDQSEKLHPGTIETVRAKARYLLVDGQFAQSETMARRALTMDAKDLETLTLLGEIALARGDLDAAVGQFNQVLNVNANWPRAQHFMAVTKLQQGNVDEAEKLLTLLVAIPHPSSEIDLWRLKYSHRSQVAEARDGLKKLLETRGITLSNYDLGRAWKSLAEIAEAQSDVPGAVAAMEKSVEVDRSSHANAFFLGRLYLTQKQYEKASNEFARASSLSPQTAEYLIFEGNALREQGKLSESLSELSKGLEKEPNNVEGLNQLGLTQRALSRNDEAITSFENVLKTDSRHLNAMINLGELYLARDNFSMAKTHFKSAIAISPQSVRAHNGLGVVLLTNRKFDDALEEFKIAEVQDAQNVDVLANMGRAYLATNRIEKASTYFEKALSIDPTRLDTQVALGELQHKRKEYTKALDTFRNVLKSRPKDFDTRVKAAAVLIDQQSFQEAVSELQEASKWNPSYYPTRLNLGIAWRGLGSLDQSLEQLSNALQLRPEAAEAHYQVEQTHIFRNDPVNAEASMQKALTFDPKFVDPLITLGDYYDGRNLYAKSVEYYLQAAKIDPKNSMVLLKIAESYRRDEKPKQAKEYYLKAISINKASADAYVGLALIAEDAGTAGKAIEYLKRAQSLDPNDPRPYYYLGFMYKDANQKQAAVMAFKKYLKLDPASKEKKDIEDQIEALSK